MNLPNFLNQLEKEGKIKRQATDISHLNASLRAASDNLASARFNLKNGYKETAFKSAYDALLQISRVILLLNGFRPDDGEQHKTTFKVAGAILGEEFAELISRIDRFRIKRNSLIYDPLHAISAAEAASILESSRIYWNQAKKYLRSSTRQLELFDF